MTRDLDLFRRILKDVEAMPVGTSIKDIKYPEYDKEIIHEHIDLLHQAKFIDVVPYKAGIPKTIRKYQINGITNLGHDFLSNSEVATAWDTTKKHFIKPVGSFSLGLVAEYLKMKVKEKLNIP